VILKRRLEAFCEELKSMQPELVYRVFSDAVPLLERGYAAQAGLGFIGKNTMLIRPKAGSFSFLGEILWNLEVEAEPAPVDVTNCGACERCITRCPSHAFSEPFVLDARRCVSYLTIEKRGAFTEGESQAIGEWLFGCDLCQEICPFNHRALKEGLASDLPEFDAHAGTGPWLNLASVLKLRSDAEFKARFRGTALLRAKREGLLRNAAVVAANTKSYELIPVLDKVAKEDPSPLVRDHAHWALRHLA
jgi:epoxyqueuosine reductase